MIPYFWSYRARFRIFGFHFPFAILPRSIVFASAVVDTENIGDSYLGRGSVIMGFGGRKLKYGSTFYFSVAAIINWSNQILINHFGSVDADAQ